MADWPHCFEACLEIVQHIQDARLIKTLALSPGSTNEKGSEEIGSHSSL